MRQAHPGDTGQSSDIFFNFENNTSNPISIREGVKIDPSDRNFCAAFFLGLKRFASEHPELINKQNTYGGDPVYIAGLDNSEIYNIYKKFIRGNKPNLFKWITFDGLPHSFETPIIRVDEDLITTFPQIFNKLDVNKGFGFSSYKVALCCAELMTNVG